MATVQEVRRLYLATIQSDNISYATLPAGAASVTLTAKNVAWNFGAWAQIAATVGAVDGWLIGIAMENPSAPLSGYDVDIGTGTAPAGASIAVVPFFTSFLTLPFPRRIPLGIGIVGRTRSSSGVADTIDAKVVILIGA